MNIGRNRHLILVLGRDVEELSDSTLQLGSSSRRLVEATVAFAAGQTGVEVCFAASDSPYATNDTTLAVLMAEYFRQFSAVRKVSVTVLTAQHFDTRGEAVAFWEFALRRGFRDLTIVAAEYHLPRVRVIVQQECGRVVGHQMRYELVFDPVGRIAHLKEWVKRYFHVYLPPDLGRVVVRGIRRFGLNTSW